MLWSLKYKPKNIGDIYGNNKQVTIASKWIKNISKNKKYKPLILYGDYSVGKTTLANVILEKNNYFVINLDYDTFTDKTKIKIAIDQYLNSNTLDKLMFKKKKQKGILIDDIDSVADKSVRKEIIKIIKKRIKHNKISLPIIFTCKDIKKLKEIRNQCLEIKLVLPNKIQLFKYGKKIIDGEKLCIDDISLQYLLKYAQNDFRKLANMLYYIQLTIESEKKDIIENAKPILDSILSKNKLLNVYEISNITLNRYSDVTSIIRLCETDKTLAGLMMHENYIPTIINNRKGNTKKKLKAIYKVSEHLSYGDIFRTNVIINKIGWHLDKYCIFQENVYPSFIINKKLKKYAYNKDSTINFTKMLSNNTQTFNNYKVIYSNKMLRDLDNESFIVIKMMLDGLFSENSNKQFVYKLIYCYNINFDIIDKLLHLFNKDYKKLYSKKKKQIIIKNYNKYIKTIG